MSAIEAVVAPRDEDRREPIFKPLSRLALYEERIEIREIRPKPRPGAPRRYRYKRDDESVN